VSRDNRDRREYFKKHRAAHPEKAKAYYAANKERLLAERCARREREEHRLAGDPAARRARREKKAREHREWRSRNLETARLREKAKRFHITLARAQTLQAITHCEACGVELSEQAYGRTARHIDHCHETGVVRGVLCHGCNVALGMLRSDPRVIERLAGYVRRRTFYSAEYLGLREEPLVGQ